ncbi:hypothetical protein C4K04_3152 [Pseudomonas chlororaphis]|uniref:Uncharacterized protein n=1 Tax=Pseudomonas chlororaphis TaxID=587753 RepID=A0A3G7TNW4_9PSED|nr:hypothetical protein C4K04_3152 [Pseudomonas chlororaphis]
MLKYRARLESILCRAPQDTAEHQAVVVPWASRFLILGNVIFNHFPGRIAEFVLLGHQGLLPLMAVISPISVFQGGAYRT